MILAYNIRPPQKYFPGHFGYFLIFHNIKKLRFSRTCGNPLKDKAGVISYFSYSRYPGKDRNLGHN
uniref:Uncharacterized protein n=1 Tax=Anguilla anguilla TaxID=7936 RepID=A0A0E9T3S7_ANGAN